MQQSRCALVKNVATSIVFPNNEILLFTIVFYLQISYLRTNRKIEGKIENPRPAPTTAVIAVPVKAPIKKDLKSC